jgi:hypothetical protein
MSEHIPTHCPCGYELAAGMRFCPYCGKRQKLKAIIVACSESESKMEHQMRDHCYNCAPWWDKFPVCPITGNKLLESGYCRECKGYHDLGELKPRVRS